MESRKNYNKELRLQVICNPLCRDIIEFLSIKKESDKEFCHHPKKITTKPTRSSIVSSILSEYFSDNKKIPVGFWEWRQEKNKSKES